MPWRELSVMEQRKEFVRLCTTRGANISELCRRFGISRQQGHKWLKRFAAEGEAGLADRSKRPKLSPKRTAETVEAEVLRIRKTNNNAWGGRKIAHHMRREGQAIVPAASTITAILRRHGKLNDAAKQHPGPYLRFERDAPNELWQMDFKGHFQVGLGRCHPLTVLDDHSRYALGLMACGGEREEEVRRHLTLIFRRYGLPEGILCDNGPPWSDPGEAYTALAAWFMRLGIKVSHGRPYHPQTQGKDERFHRSLKAEVLAGNSFADLSQCQKAFDRWRPIYNGERPHEGLGFAVPAERYQISPRRFLEVLPAIDYAPGDAVRQVDVNGRLSFHNHLWRVGKAFRHQPVALRPTREDGVFTLHYCAHLIGCLDLHRQLLKTGAQAVDKLALDRQQQQQQDAQS